MNGDDALSNMIARLKPLVDGYADAVIEHTLDAAHIYIDADRDRIKHEVMKELGSTSNPDWWDMN